ncbi:phosphoribosylglycinamide formyltransferase [Bdellovibrionota bacterium]
MVVLVSGRGTNLQAVIDHCKNSPIAEIVEVISDKPDAKGLDRAMRAGIKTTKLPHPSDKTTRNAELLKRLEELNPDLIVLAGYMRIVPKEIVDRFYGKMINIHPSLLPSFPGLEAQQQALDYGVKVTGCTVHFVDPEVDSGPVILQHSVPVENQETLKNLSDRILGYEHQILTRAVDLFCNDKLRIVGRKVEILEK